MPIVARILPSQSVLRKLLDYDPETGIFHWKERAVFDQWDKTFNSKFAGREALIKRHPNGYLCGCFKKQAVLAHRVAWKWFYGDEPTFIDHINGKKTDNSIKNLRSISLSENSRNQPRKSNNTSGFLGIMRARNLRWRSVIYNKGSEVGLYYGPCFGKAFVARKAAETYFGYHENHGRAAKRAAA